MLKIDKNIRGKRSVLRKMMRYLAKVLPLFLHKFTFDIRTKVSMRVGEGKKVDSAKKQIAALVAATVRIKICS